MLRHRLRSRLLLAAIAAGQALSPGVASIADARPEAFSLSRHVAAHVENFGAKHSWSWRSDDCALCQIVNRTVAPPDAAPFFLAEASWTPAAPDRTAPAPRSPSWDAPRSRAPPAV